MTSIDYSIRAYQSPEAQSLFDDIVTQRVLGASAHIKMISLMIQDLCSSARSQNETPNELNVKIHQLADFFVKTRGESCQAVTNAISTMTHGTEDQTVNNLETYIKFVLEKINGFEQENKKNLELINQYSQYLLADMKSVLLFDYSSTVGRMIETCNHRLDVFIAESRALDGGRTYVSQALKGGHSVHFIPDAAIFFYLKQCDGVFIGAETYYPDGRVFNTIGSVIGCSPLQNLSCKIQYSRFSGSSSSFSSVHLLSLRALVPLRHTSLGSYFATSFLTSSTIAPAIFSGGNNWSTAFRSTAAFAMPKTTDDFSS